jgi:DnaJ-class molecular chaperone
MIRRPGSDLCGRRHAVTGMECCLADTHYPRAHVGLDGSTWHDGLCDKCRGGGESDSQTCDKCNGTGFTLVDPNLA